MSDQQNLTELFAAIGLELSDPRFSSTVGRDAVSTLGTVGSRAIILGSDASEAMMEQAAKIAEAGKFSCLRESNQKIGSVRQAAKTAAKKKNYSVHFRALKTDSDGTVGYVITRTK